MEVLPHARVNGVSMNGNVQRFEENRQSLKSGSANVNVNKSGTVYPDEKRFFSVFLLVFFSEHLQLLTVLVTHYNG